MPRGKRPTTTSGAPAQPIHSVPGRRYGEGPQMAALQQAAPAVDARRATIQAGPAGAAMTSQQSGLDPAALLAMGPINQLSGTRLPNQPVTSGLSSGPGVGPEGLRGLRASTPLARMLRTLSERSGDPTFAELAERARL